VQSTYGFRRKNEKMIAAFFVFLLAGSASAQGDSDGMLLSDYEFASGCGPIASFVALKSLGFSTSLDETAKMCNWKPGKRTTLAEIESGLNTFREIHVSAGHTSPERLVSALSTGKRVAILATRENSEEVNHAMCAVEVQAGKIRFIDYPNLDRNVSVEELPAIWDGAVLIIERRVNWAASIGLFVLALFATGLVLRVWHKSVWLRRNLASVLIFFIAYPFAPFERCYSDDKVCKWEQARQTFNIDFGIIEQNQFIQTSVVIENKLGKDIVLIEPSLSCGCLSVLEKIGKIEAGKDGKMVFSLDTKGKRGNLLQTALIGSPNRDEQLIVNFRAVVRGVWTQPESPILIANFEARESNKTSFEVLSSGYENVKIKSCYASDSWLTSTDYPLFEPPSMQAESVRARRRVVVELPKDIDSKNVGNSSKITLELDCGTGETFQLEVPVRVIRQKDSAFVGNIFFGTIKSSEVERDLRFSKQVAEKLIEVKDLSVSFEHDEISGKIEEIGGELVLRTKFIPNEKTKVGFFSGQAKAINAGKLVFEAKYQGIVYAK